MTMEQRVTRAELARLAGVSRPAVTSWIKTGRDFPRSGSDGRFLLTEVTNWLASRRVHGSIRGAGDRAEGSYADRIWRSLAAAAPTMPGSRPAPTLAEVLSMRLPGDGATGDIDNLVFMLTAVFLRTRVPHAWAGLRDLYPPDVGAVGARWLVDRVATAAERTARRHGMHPAVFAALRRLMPEHVSRVREFLVQCSALGAEHVQLIINAYEAALPAGAFLTPQTVASLLAEMIIDETARSVYDPFLRGGELLTAAVDAAASSEDLCLRGVGSDTTALSLAGVNLLIRGEKAVLLPADQAHRVQVTHVLANPPFGVDSWIDERPVPGGALFPAPPPRSAFRWLLHCLDQLSGEGRAAIVMPPAAAFSVNTIERKIRRELIDRAMLEAVIALPSGLYAGADVATSVWILRRERSGDWPVLFVDAASLGRQRDGRTVLDETARKRVVQAYRSFLSGSAVEQWNDGERNMSAVVDRSSVISDRCSFNPAEYVINRSKPPSDSDDLRAVLHQSYDRVLRSYGDANRSAADVARPLTAQTVPLKDVCEVKAGFRYSRLPSDQRSRTEGIPIVMPHHLRNGRIEATDLRLAPKEKADRLSSYELKAGDVLCVRTGALTPPAVVDTRQRGWLMSTNLLRLRVHDTGLLDPYYLCAYLRSIAAREEMKTFAGATATAYVTAADVGALMIPLPSLDRQHEVTAALHVLDQEVVVARDLVSVATAARDATEHRLFGGAR
ncbi:N-6 DNA methylase [Actinoplanes sp. NPDC051851]|uniref:N-6 DNA methylase n=1 Tax=Actinoplanes sp. NPDC051851 TaxID=3154753 RepID=UPI0034179931